MIFRRQNYEKRWKQPKNALLFLFLPILFCIKKSENLCALRKKV